MKLIDILKLEQSSFKLTNKRIDKETGAISHKVKYTPEYNILKLIDQMDEQFKIAIRTHKDDAKMRELATLFGQLRRKFRRHARDYYGEER